MCELLQGHSGTEAATRCYRCSVGLFPLAEACTLQQSSVSLANQHDVAGSEHANRLGQFEGNRSQRVCFQAAAVACELDTDHRLQAR